ncbi:MAG: DegT/DnrJ/EryC1/StrS aminotransferase family protein [Patescibacteria group bacterium]|nr:DegT/DnrJ/EryC1/StrS aminotransferase family protein [Patescibacteria group bacterium]MDE2438451.1 DegT/DnrJ/EryC1/StrS aminotransferase family protein [Patescibacteria group bacterium]
MKPTREQFLPFGLPLLGEEEINEVVATLASGWLSTGPKTLQFEKEFAAYVGVKEAVGLTSCTAALHLALLAHGIGAGDEVLLPSFTFAATANMVVNVGAKPIFVDIAEEDFCIDPDLLERSITANTKAIIVVHYAGLPARMEAINALAKKHHLVVIEDAAHAAGSEYKGKKIGGLGNTASFSFYATKNMSTGEGGMLTTDDPDVADFVRKNRLHGISKDAWKRYEKEGSWRYDVEYAGWKYNMFDLQAAIGVHQLRKLDAFLEKRNDYAIQYDNAFEGVKGLILPPKKMDAFHSYHLYPIRVQSMPRDHFIEKMAERNIGTSVHFIPLHLQSFYQKTFGYREGDLPATERIFNEIVSIPLYPKMTEEDVAYIIESVHQILK